MPKTVVPEVADKTEMVNEIASFFFGTAPQSVEQKTTGLTNLVFEANIASEAYIIRIGGSPSKLYDYQKEQWAATKMQEKGVPVAEILGSRQPGHRPAVHDTEKRWKEKMRFTTPRLWTS